MNMYDHTTLQTGRAFALIALLSVFVLIGCNREAPASTSTPNKSASSPSIDALTSSSVNSASLTGTILAPSTLPAGTFDAATGSGTVYVRGYSEIIPVEEPFCAKDCKRYRYVTFRLVEEPSVALRTFMSDNEGNAYLSKNALGIGCVEGDHIVYENDSDTVGRKQYALAPEVAQLLLKTDASTPIVLQLTKYSLMGGSGADACYSHFADIIPIAM